MSTPFAVGMQVHITMPMVPGIATTGKIYYHMRGHQYPWHVRPDNWEKKRAGIAFAASELEPLSASEQEVQHA